MIPKILLYFWHDLSKIPTNIVTAMEKTINQHRDFEVIRMDDDAALDLIEKSAGRKAALLYQNIPIPAARSDLARLFMLKEYGGIYVDCAIEMSTYIGNLHPPNAELLLMSIDHGQDIALTHVTNALLGTSACNLLIEELIATILDTLYAKRYNKEVWFSTGPFLLNLLLKKHRPESACYLRKSRLGECFEWRRASGISNAWVKQQIQLGVVSDSFYTLFKPKPAVLLEVLYRDLLESEELLGNPHFCKAMARRCIEDRDFLTAARLLRKASAALPQWAGEADWLEPKINEMIRLVRNCV